MTSALNLFSDYLFLYLPWWLEKHPDSGFALPTAPADFTRFGFFLGRWATDLPRPKGFKEMAERRRLSGHSRQLLYSQLCGYFDYVIASKDSFPELRDRMFTNPIVKSIDLPKKFRNSKTNKIPIDKRVLPYFLRYTYCAECFGSNLQQLCISGKLNLGKYGFQNQPFVRPCSFNLNVTVELDERHIPINEFPSALFGWPQRPRSFNLPDGTVKPVWLPHLAELRLCITMLETGLRGQGAQWLDRRTFDNLNKGKPHDLYVYDLLVNTDKVKDKPWITPIVHRAREALIREAQFQTSIVEPNLDRPVPYEGRPNSRFGEIVPLFRSSGTSGQPVADTEYTEIWSILLAGFERWYNTHIATDDEIELTKLIPLNRKGPADEPAVEYERVARDIFAPYCPIRLKALHTPHSARSTFISSRSGILAVEDIAELVGHGNIATTYHYTVESNEELWRKAELASRALWSPSPENPVHIRADAENSALRRAFGTDRAATEKAYRFQSISLVNDADSDFQDGVELLRTTPASQVAFRETHICPIGEVCPSEILPVIVEPRRCGLCPLAVKSVDHVTAIAAKRNQLMEQAKVATLLLGKMKARHEPIKTQEEVNDRRRLDILEAQGWERAIIVLSQHITQMQTNGQIVFHVEQPEAVRLHLRLVAKQTDAVEFILHRITDSHVYPAVETPEVRSNAHIMRQKLLANLGALDEALKEIELGTEIEAFLSTAKVAAAAYGIDNTFTNSLMVVAEVEAGKKLRSRRSGDTKLLSGR